VAGMPNYGSASARTSFEPRHGENRQAGTSLLSQTARGRQADREPARRTSERYGTTAAPSGTIRRISRDSRDQRLSPYVTALPESELPYRRFGAYAQAGATYLMGVQIS